MSRIFWHQKTYENWCGFSSFVSNYPLYTMEFSDDILSVIRDFSRPIGTRLDWRTCKRDEANVIHWHNRYTLNHSWHIYTETRYMTEEIATWTLHGRRRALRFLIQTLPTPILDNWYETRISNYGQVWDNQRGVTGCFKYFGKLMVDELFLLQ